MKIACDVDGTLLHHAGPKEDTPRYEIITMLLLLQRLGHEIFIWSGGGVDYAERWAQKLGINAKVVAKGSFKPDMAIDDEDVN